MNIFQGTVTLKSIELVATDTKKFLFQVNEFTSLDGKTKGSGKLDFKAGQFISLKFNETAWRAYSIASAPSEDLIELIVRIVPGGVGSMVLDAAKVEDTFDFKAPFGHFLLSENSEANLIFLGTGTGIAPFKSMILTENAKASPRKMKLFYGGRNLEDLAYLDEISTWSPEYLVSVRLGLSQSPNASDLNPQAQHCRITKFLEVDEDFDENSEFYICGNGSMVKSVQEILAQKNVDPKRIFMERFN